MYVAVMGDATAGTATVNEGAEGDVVWMDVGGRGGRPSRAVDDDVTEVGVDDDAGGVVLICPIVWDCLPNDGDANAEEEEEEEEEAEASGETSDADAEADAEVVEARGSFIKSPTLTTCGDDDDNDDDSEEAVELDVLLPLLSFSDTVAAAAAAAIASLLLPCLLPCLLSFAVSFAALIGSSTEVSESEDARSSSPILVIAALSGLGREAPEYTRFRPSEPAEEEEEEVEEDGVEEEVDGVEEEEEGVAEVAGDGSVAVAVETGTAAIAGGAAAAVTVDDAGASVATGGGAGWPEGCWMITVCTPPGYTTCC